MKNLLLPIVFCATFIFFSASYSENESGQLGDIKYSILPPEQFYKLNGLGWTLIDGRNIEGQGLHKFLKSESMVEILEGSKKIPDARNLFIRNMGKTGRDVGSIQKYATKFPNKPFINSQNGLHDHPTIKYDDIYMMTDWDGKAKGANEKKNPKKMTYLRTGKNSDGWVNYDYENRFNQYVPKEIKISKSGNHTHKITGGDKETRPENISFYVYMKIN